MTFAVTMEVGRLSRGTHFVGPIAIATMVAWLGHLGLDLEHLELSSFVQNKMENEQRKWKTSRRPIYFARELRAARLQYEYDVFRVIVWVVGCQK